MNFIESNERLDPHLHLLMLRMQTVTDKKKHTLKRIAYLSKTRMFDDLLLEVNTLENLTYPNLPKQLKQAKEKTQAQKKQLNEDHIDAIIEDLYIKSQQIDEENEQVDLGQLNIYKLSKIYYDEGNYMKSYEIITALEKQDLNNNLWLKVTWAKLYCEIMLRKVEAKVTLEILRIKIQEINGIQSKNFKKDIQSISNQASSTIMKHYGRLQQFLNLSCFALFYEARDEDLQKFIEIVTSKSCYPVMQISCNYLLRYICVAIILNKSLQKGKNFDLIRLIEVINRGSIKYKDSFIEFIRQLFIEFNFEIIAQKIKKIRQEIKQDIFLINLEQKIIQNCQFLYFKIYSKIHQEITLKNIAKFINKSQDQAELWILSFIRSADIEAKINSTLGIIINLKNRQNNYQKHVSMIPDLNTFINSLARINQQQ